MDQTVSQCIKVSFDKVKFFTNEIPNSILNNNYPRVIIIDGAQFKTNGPRFNISKKRKRKKNEKGNENTEVETYFVKNLYYNEQTNGSGKRRVFYVGFIPREKKNNNSTQAMVTFIPTVKSEFNFKMMLEIMDQLGLDSFKMQLSILEIAIDFYNYEPNVVRNSLWAKSQSSCYCYADKDGETIETEFSTDPPGLFTMYIGRRGYKSVKCYEKAECGETFFRTEITMYRNFIKRKVNEIGDLLVNDFNWIYDSGAIGWFKLNFEKLGSKYDTPLKIKNLAKRYPLKELFRLLEYKHGKIVNQKRDYLISLGWEETVKKELAIFLERFRDCC